MSARHSEVGVVARSADLEGLRLRTYGARSFATVDAAIRWACPVEVLRAIDLSSPGASADFSQAGRTADERGLVLWALGAAPDNGMRLALCLYAHRASVKIVARVVRRREQVVRAWLAEGREAVSARLRYLGMLRE